MVEAQRDEREDRPEDTQDLGGQVAALHAEETAQTHEPVAADGAQEDHVPVGGDLLLGREGDDFGFIGIEIEDAAVCSGQSSPRYTKRSDVQPKIMATMNSDPARFPQNVTVQCRSIFSGERRRCRTETAVYCSGRQRPS